MQTSGACSTRARPAGARAMRDTPGCTARAFWEPVSTAAAPRAAMSSFSARKLLMASTIRRMPFSRQKSATISMS